MVVVIALLFFVAVLLCFCTKKRPSNFPPGPLPLPIVGNFYQLPDENTNLFVTIRKMVETYGPIIGLSFGRTLLVLVDGADNVLEALRREEFQNRPELHSFMVRSFEKNLGIFFSNGEQWISSRKFVVRNLKGYGKNRHENIIAEEIDIFLDTIKDGMTIKGTGIFTITAVNVIWRMIANKRVEVEDEAAKRFLNNISLYFRQGNPAGNDIVNLCSVFQYFSTKFKFSVKVIEETQDFIREAIKDHKEVLDINNPVDLFDYYLVEMERMKDNQLFSEEDLITVAFDLFSAGAESTSNSIEFILLYMILYPEVQAKMQEEIDQVLNRNRKPTLDDRSDMPYTMAVITEVERLNSIAPSSALHVCAKGTVFGGYFIPKGTVILMNLKSLGYDPKYWENADGFFPERFLREDGSFSKPAMLATFGLGQRQCLGDTFARNTIFLATTTFFERFSISLPPGEPKPSTDPLPGFTTAPQPFKITVKNRY